MINNTLLLIIAALLVAPAYGVDIEIVTEQYPPFNYRKEGVVGGIATEKVKAVLAELELETNIRVMRWSRAFRRASGRRNVLIYSIARTPEREDLFHWVGLVAPFEIYLYSLKTRNDIIIGNHKELRNWNIGVVEGDVRDQYFTEQGNFNVYRYNNSRDVVNALINGEIDLMPAAKLNFPYIIDYLDYEENMFATRYFLEEISDGGLYMAFGKRTSLAVVEKFREALASVNSQKQ